MSKYYVYQHINAITKEVFYIGKGCGKRAFSKQLRNKFWHNMVNKYGFEVEIVEENLSQQEACEREIYWINFFGRRDIKTGCLVNMTSGGDGNNDFSPETRKIISDKAKLRPSPRKGAILSETEKIAISETLKRKYISGEWQPNISGLHTTQAKEKRSNSRKGKPTWNKGLTDIYSEQVKNKISDGLKRYYAEMSPIEGRDKKKKDRMKKYNALRREAKKKLPKKPRKKRILTQEHKNNIGKAARLRALNSKKNNNETIIN